MPKISFERPPLVEVSFGVQFERLTAFRSGHFGLFWSRLANDFPETADRPPMAPLASGATTDEWLPLPRVWFVHRDKHLLIQVQNDRFLLNWRRLRDDAVYPRFDTVLPVFIGYLKSWEAYCEASRLGGLKLNEAELTYVNHIPKGRGWAKREDLSHLVPSLVSAISADRMPLPVSIASTAVYDFATLQLRADLKHGYTGSGDDRQEIVVLDMKAESAGRLPAGPEGLEVWFKDANDAIVRSFVALTSDSVQREVWKRVDS
jgi:uncharacterized protein (TIGR04255 family)